MSFYGSLGQAVVVQHENSWEYGPKEGISKEEQA